MLNFDQLKSFILKPDDFLKDALVSLNKTQARVSLVCDKRKLIGVITDGDVRRFLIKSNSLNIRLKNLCNKKFVYRYKTHNHDDLKKLIYRKKLLAIPIVDKKKFLIGLVTKSSLKETNKKEIENMVFILAGGKGLRMRPLTNNLPKPMIKLGDSSILERQLKIFKKNGFKHIKISTNYLANKIIDKFGDGGKINLNIAYVKERKYLDTAGSLSLLKTKDISDNFIIINGDILADIDFSEILKYHNSKKFDFTICVKNHFYKLPFGLVEKKKNYLINEKPSISHLINSGIYICNKKLLKLLNYNKKISMTDFINLVYKKKYKVGIYPIYENIYDFSDLETLRKLTKKLNV
jgi:dTDP-glucose pyrophosphorylase